MSHFFNQTFDLLIYKAILVKLYNANIKSFLYFSYFGQCRKFLKICILKSLLKFQNGNPLVHLLIHG